MLARSLHTLRVATGCIEVYGIWVRATADSRETPRASYELRQPKGRHVPWNPVPCSQPPQCCFEGMWSTHRCSHMSTVEVRVTTIEWGPCEWPTSSHLHNTQHTHHNTLHPGPYPSNCAVRCSCRVWCRNRVANTVSVTANPDHPICEPTATSITSQPEGHPDLLPLSYGHPSSTTPL